APWQSNLEILQQQAPPALLTLADPAKGVAAWLAFDIDNPASIIACVNRARNNARSIRGTIGPDVWRALNNLYWQLRDPEFVNRAKESPHEYYQAVEAGSQLFQGVCDATLPHDEGWQFLRIGKYLERADKTIRILDTKERQLQRLSTDEDLPLVGLEWAGVLQSCRGYEAYQRLTIARVEDERVIDFLLLNRSFPRSVRFCLEEVHAALAGIETTAGYRGESAVDMAIGRVLSDLRYTDIQTVFGPNFHDFMSGLLQKCSVVSRSIQERYSLVN
ncbi:MAG: alpha-E domain-containing protein, partial [Gemmataceae bacterium]